MQSRYPKFDQKIEDQILSKKFQQSKPRPGTIISYDQSTNSATIMLDEQYSDYIGSMMSNVPCPLNYGIQTVAPAPGTRCYVAFRDGTEQYPYILNYFNDNANQYKNIINSSVDTGIPKFMA